MPLSDLQLATKVSASFQAADGDFPGVSQGPNELRFNLTGIDLTDFDQAYVNVLTIAPSGTTTVNLQSFTNLAGEAVVLTSVLAIFVKVEGATGVLTIKPGSSNGLAAWFFPGTTNPVTLKHGDMLCVARDPGETPVVVDATHKTIDFSNTGAASIDVSVVIVGGT